MNDLEQRRMAAAATHASCIACRLCGGESALRFYKRVLNKHTVRYFECGTCRSLQTEAPHWLSEAYGSNLAELDTGAAQRNLNSMAATLAVCKLFKLRNAVDFGGGDGLLCRLLRDHRINCYVQDRYAHTAYAQGFTEPDFHKPDLRLAFEVFEHFSEPKTDLAAIFDDEPDTVFGSTVNYAGQGAEWDYLAASAGQHVFFYSAQALEAIGKRRGYDVMLQGAFFLFVRHQRGTGSSSRCCANCFEARPCAFCERSSAHGRRLARRSIRTRWRFTLSA